MSKMLSVFMSMLVLAQSFNIGLEEISKLNVLLEHAQYHQEQYGDSFFEFLTEHYGSKTHNHKDNGLSHENLPFKHLDCSHSQTFIVENIDFNFTNNPEIYFQKSIFFYRESNSFFEKTSIFQPPKFA